MTAAVEQDAAAAAAARSRADQLMAEAEVAAAERLVQAAELESRQRCERAAAHEPSPWTGGFWVGGLCLRLAAAVEHADWPQHDQQNLQLVVDSRNCRLCRLAYQTLRCYTLTPESAIDHSENFASSHPPTADGAH